MNDKITKVHQFAHPINMIWDAITLEEEISTWFIPADFKAEKGYKYTFKHKAEDQCTTINGEILTVNPITELVYTWVVEGTDIITTVSWKLTENAAGTLLELEHSGISNFPGQSAVEMFESFNGGWDNCIKGLTKHLIGENA